MENFGPAQLMGIDFSGSHPRISARVNKVYRLHDISESHISPKDCHFSQTGLPGLNKLQLYPLHTSNTPPTLVVGHQILVLHLPRLTAISREDVGVFPDAKAP